MTVKDVQDIHELGVMILGLIGLGLLACLGQLVWLTMRRK